MENIAGIKDIVDQEKGRFTRYPTYEDLSKHAQQLRNAHPELVRLERVGHGADRTARYPEGRPIEAMIISSPGTKVERPYALVQVEHENELPAAAAIQLMADIVCQNPWVLDMIGCNLIFHNQAHPDGIALQRWAKEANEHGHLDPLTYLRGFFRSQAVEQIAWGFPFHYKNASFNEPSPEVHASMRLMSTYRPSRLYSVHGADVDGAHFYVSHPHPALTEQLIRAMLGNNLPLQETEAEVPYVKKVAPGIYTPVLSVPLAYDHIKQNLPAGKTMRWTWNGGTTAIGFLSTVLGRTPFTLFSEAPLLTASVLGDHTPAELTRREAESISIEKQRFIIGRIAHYFALIQPTLAGQSRPDIDRLVRSIQWWHTQDAPERVKMIEDNLESPAFNHQATRAEAFGVIQRWEFYLSRCLGQVCHLAALLGKNGVANDVAGELAQIIEGINTVSPLRVTPLPDMIGAQALGGFAALYHANNIRVA